MSARWPDKYIIGLTGNIATGKSVVRKMLEHLGAYGIDADQLAHRAMSKGAPGYEPVVRTFGTWILRPDGQIDRQRLARVVFSDPEALRQLEAILHPIVVKAIEFMIQRSRYRVIVIEAIKLLESPLREWCDAIWVVDAPEPLQLRRLIRERGMSEEEAYQRLRAQPPQAEKLAQADVIIRNDGDLESTWRQVVAAWERIPARYREKPEPEAAPAAPREAAPAAAPPKPEAKPAPAPEVTVRKATPRDAERISQFIAEVTQNRERPSRMDIIARFGDRAYVLVEDREGRMVGLLGWQVENLVARVPEVYLAHSVPAEAVLRPALEFIEQNARELQSEALLLFVPPELARQARNLWQALGFDQRTVEQLGVQAWVEAARESQPEGTVMLFKQLRKDRILHPL